MQFIGIYALIAIALLIIASKLSRWVVDRRLTAEVERDYEECKKNARASILAHGLDQSDPVSDAVFSWLRTHPGAAIKLTPQQAGNFFEGTYFIPEFSVGSTAIESGLNTHCRALS
ncbi:MAG TPA: hypothetical protein VKI44_40675 [Acetobacteraceae bacterium]|nr:hypothetical protein [Acetobacteraceae bacterium]